MSEDQTLRVAVQAVRLYAESHPRPTQVTQAQAVEKFNANQNKDQTNG